MKGRCIVCGHEGEFIAQSENREGFLCGNCGTSSRHRAVVYALGCTLGVKDLPAVAWPPRKDMKILESSGRSSYPMVFGDKFTYCNTEYNPAEPDMMKPFTGFADFQNLAYPDNTLDVVIASDVFEHVREDEKGFREVFRVLKRGGMFIMTVPYNHDWESTQIRVKVEGEKDIHVLPPEYHGGGGHTLAYRTFGRDVMDRLRMYGFTVGCLELSVPEFGIVPQFVFVCVKGGYIELKHFLAAPVTVQVTRSLKASPLFLFRLFLTFKYNLFSLGHFLGEIRRKTKNAS